MFMYIAIDGEFLYDIDDDDLKNSLGIEHRLHRKKILNCIRNLKSAEVSIDQRMEKVNNNRNRNMSLMQVKIY